MYAQTVEPTISVPPMNTYVKKAVSSYQTASTSGMGDREVMAEACKVIINNLTLARDAYQRRNIDTMLTYNLKNIKILDVLREELAGSDVLKDAEAVPPARFLLHTYRTMVLKLTNILTTTDPLKEFDTLIDNMKPVYRAWLPPVEARVGSAADMITNA